MSAQASPPIRSRSRWWHYLCWLLGLGLLCLLLLTWGLWWAWHHPKSIFQAVLQHVEGNFKAEVSDVRWQGEDLLLQQLVLTDKTSGKTVLKAEEIAWRPDFAHVHQQKLGRVKIHGLTVDVDAALARTLEPTLLAPPAAKPVSKGAGFEFEKLELQNVRLRFAGTDRLPALELRMDHQSEGLDFSDLAHPVIQKGKLTLNELKLDGNALPQVQLEGGIAPDGTLNIDRLSLAGGSLQSSPRLMKLLTEPAPSAPDKARLIKGVRLGEVRLVDFRVTSEAIEAWLPVSWPRWQGQLACTLKEVAISETGGLSLGEQELDLKDVQVQSKQDQGRLTVPLLRFSLAKAQPAGLWQVRELVLQKPVIEWTQGLEDALFPATPDTATKSQAASDQIIKGMQLEVVRVEDAQVSVQRTKRVSYAGRTSLDLQCTNLRVDAQGIASPQAQTLKLQNLSVAEHPADRLQPLEPFAEWESAKLVVVPDDWKNAGTVAELDMQKPRVRAHQENVSWFHSKSAATTTPATSQPSDSVWSKLNFQQLHVSAGFIDYADDVGPRLELQGKWAITTEAGAHKIKLQQVRGLLPQQARLPVAGFEEIEAVVRLPSLWQNKHIDALRLVGGEIDVGDALMALVSPPAASTPSAKPATSESPLQGWKLHDLSIKDTAITLQRVAPGLPPLKFDVNYQAKDLPLTPAELVGNLKAQRVELSQLAIKSPYESLRNVAMLPTVFVDFTLDGLLRQSIDKVEIISPSLFVGEDLFWYVEYYRKYAAGEPLPGAPAARMAGTDKMLALELATSAAVAPVKEVGTWNVDTLQVHGGKLIIAPKGRPLRGIPRPFPFSFTSKLNQGKLEAAFDIPSDTYTWEQMKVELENLRGKVLFNLPLKTVDNNLTETFQVDRIRYKQLHIDKAHLSVTYDANGIYGKFGGVAYEGYVNGAFNVYNDTNYSWDGWISGTGVRTTEITQKLCPAYLLLDGKVDTTIVAQGNMNEIYQCDLKFKNNTRGKFSITALNDMLAALPKDLAGYQQDLMRIGVDALRDLDYDTIDAQCRFYGREGKGYLRVAGAAGTRNIDVNIYDHRWHVPAAPKIQVSTTDSP